MGLKLQLRNQLWPVLWVMSASLYCMVTVSKWAQRAELLDSCNTGGMAESREGRVDVLAPGAAQDRLLGCHKWSNAVSILYHGALQMWDVFNGSWICFPCHQHKMHANSRKCSKQGRQAVISPRQDSTPPVSQSSAFYALSLTPISCIHPLPKSPLPSFALFPASRVQKIAAISEQCVWGLCAPGCISIGSRHICLHSRRTALQSAKIKPQKIKRKAS